MANQCCRGLTVLLVFGQLTCVASAEVLSSQEGGFSIEVPKLPAPSYEWTDRRTNRAWIVSYKEQPAQRTVSPAYLEKYYDVIAQAVLDGAKGNLIRQGPVVRGNLTGRGIVLQVGTADKPMMTRQQFFLTEDRFYTLTF